MATITKPKLRPITLEEMEYEIAFHFGWQRCLIVPNVKGIVAHEMDVAVLQPSGYLYEIEIKRTLADFHQDAKKRHGHIDKQNRIVEFYYAVPEEIWENIMMDFAMNPTDAGLISICKIEEGRCSVTVRSPATRRKGAKKLTPKEQQKLGHLGCTRIWGLKKKVDKKNLNRKQFTDAVRSATRGRLMRLKKKIKELSTGKAGLDWNKVSKASHDKYLIESIRDDMLRSLK